MPPVSVAQALAAVFGLFVAAVIAWAVIVDDPLGGEPIAVAPIPLRATGAEAAKGGAVGSRHDGPSGSTSEPAASAGNTITITDGTSGKQLHVTIPGPPQQPQSEVRANERLRELTDDRGRMTDDGVPVR